MTLHSRPTHEAVMVIPSALLPKHNIGQGFFPTSAGTPGGPVVGYGLLGYLMNEDHVGFLARDQHETNADYRGICTYALLQLDGWYYSYRRAGSSDGRLVGRKSIGVGGHVNHNDTQGDDYYGRAGGMSTVARANQREIREELTLEEIGGGKLGCVLLGLINDTENPVGLVHLGVVYGVELPIPRPKIRDTSALSDGEWASPTQLVTEVDQYEPWSQILIKQFISRGRP